MDMLVALIQAVFFCGLLYGLYLSITFAASEERLELERKLEPHSRRFTYDPLIADSLGSRPPTPAARAFAP